MTNLLKQYEAFGLSQLIIHCLGYNNENAHHMEQISIFHISAGLHEYISSFACFLKLNMISLYSRLYEGVRNKMKFIFI